MYQEEITAQEIINNQVQDFEKEIINMFNLIETFYVKFHVYEGMEDVITEAKDEFIRKNRHMLNQEQIERIYNI